MDSRTLGLVTYLTMAAGPPWSFLQLFCNLLISVSHLLFDIFRFLWIWGRSDTRIHETLVAITRCRKSDMWY